MVPFSFGGHDFTALPDGALYWPTRGALLVADLHLEKASWYAGGGQMLPPYDSLATLTELTAIVRQTGAREVWCLGDSFHDAEGCDRLPADARAMLLTLTGSTRWTWITGNHDPVLRDRCGGAVTQEALVDGLVLRHEADPVETRPGKLVARRCFVGTASKLILPAFGSLTGGLDVDHPALIQAVGRSAEALVPVRDRMLRFPVAA